MSVKLLYRSWSAVVYRYRINHVPAVLSEIRILKYVCNLTGFLSQHKFLKLTFAFSTCVYRDRCASCIYHATMPRPERAFPKQRQVHIVCTCMWCKLILTNLISIIVWHGVFRCAHGTEQSPAGSTIFAYLEKDIIWMQSKCHLYLRYVVKRSCNIFE